MTQSSAAITARTIRKSFGEHTRSIERAAGEDTGTPGRSR
jgi:hypothetical protein